MRDLSQMKSRTKTSMVLDHLRRYGSITPIEAIRHYGALRLAAIIGELRHEYGVAIRTEMLSAISSITQRPVQYANYILIK